MWESSGGLVLREVTVCTITITKNCVCGGRSDLEVTEGLGWRVTGILVAVGTVISMIKIRNLNTIIYSVQKL